MQQAEIDVFHSVPMQHTECVSYAYKLCAYGFNCDESLARLSEVIADKKPTKQVNMFPWTV